MHKNNFCIIPNKAIIYEDSITMSQSTIYKNKENNNNKNNNIKKLKESFFNKEFKHENISYLSKKSNESQYIKNILLSKKVLSKYTYSKMFNYELNNINNIIKNKKCHLTALYNEIIIYNNKTEYLKNYYKYEDAIKIIPKREIYFKHLMQFLERPIYKNFIYNRIQKQIGLDKLNIYRRINYPKKLNKNLDLNNNICNNNIIFNSNVIETIENCSTSITQYSNRNQNNNKDKNNNENETSIISEIKFNNNYTNKKNDNNNISCIDNSLIIIMKDLSISQKTINAYLCKYNSNYKNLYDKIKSKTKIHKIANKSDIEEKNKVEEKKSTQLKDNENKNIKKSIQIKNLSNINFFKKRLTNKQNSDITTLKKEEKNIDENEFIHNSVNSHKLINNIKIIPFNCNNLNSQINNKKLRCTSKKVCLSSLAKNKPLAIHNLKKKFSIHKKIFNKNNNNLYKYFNSNTSKEKNNDLNLVNFLNNNKIIYNLNNKDIKKIVKMKEPKYKSMKKNINTQKFLTESSTCMPDLTLLNENEAKKKYHIINLVRSISISNNQFLNQKI